MNKEYLIINKYYLESIVNKMVPQYINSRIENYSESPVFWYLKKTLPKLLEGQPMRVCIHRGSKEIGGSCVEVISGGKRLLIDLGLPLDAIDNDKKYLPDISGLDGSDDSLLAIIISHPHLDHFGLLCQ